jgi:hypothetical protein
VDTLEENRVVLRPIPGLQAAPRPWSGAAVDMRLDVRRVALVPFQPGAGVTPAMATDLTTTLAGVLADRLGVVVDEAPFLADTADARAVAAEGGADILLSGEIAAEGKDLRIVMSMTRTRKALGLETVTMAWPGGASGVERGGDTTGGLPAPPPGCRRARDTGESGPLLTLFPCRFRTRSLYAVFRDRIETWDVAGDSLRTVISRDLAGPWPVQVPTRWPVAGVATIDRYFDIKTKKETRAFYALCSNQRARYVNLAEDIETPDSLYVSVSAGPSDTLAGSSGSCFPKVNLVDAPRRYAVPPGLPATATSRLALSRVVVGPAGLPSLDEQGRPKTESLAVIYYDQASASLWISLADSAWQVPGRFGNAMDTWRPGLTGPPGFLVTSARSPAEGDRLEYWTLRGHDLRREWESPWLSGAITALESGDLDGDGRDDLVLGEVFRRGDGFITRVHLMRSRMRGVQP